MSLVVLRQQKPLTLSAGFTLLFAALSFGGGVLPASAAELHLHTALEVFAIAISLMVFALTWSLRHDRHGSFYGFLGAAFLAVALVDLAHTLSYPGMADLVTPNADGKSLFFWLAGRGLLAAALLASASLPYRAWPSAGHFGLLAMALATVTGIVHLGLHASPLLERLRGADSPVAALEYGLAALYALAAARLGRRARREGDGDLAWLAAATWILGLGELFFAVHTRVGESFSVSGHLFRMAAYLMIYRSLVVAGVRAPYRQLAAEREKLAELEQRWNFAIEGSGLGIWDWNPQTDATYWSATALQWLGWRENELPNTMEVWRKSVHPDDRAGAGEAFARHLRGETPIFEHRQRLRARDGSWRWVLLRGKVMARDAARRANRVVGTATDITPLMEAQAALHESETRYRSVIDGMAEGMILHGRDGRVLACNRAAERILGVPAGQLLGADGLFPKGRAVGEDGQPCPPERFPAARTLATGQPQRGMVLGVLRDHDITWLSINTQPLLQPGETAPHAAVCTFEDITQRQRDLDALRQSEERFRTIFDATPTGVALLTTGGHIVQANPAMARMFGHGAADFGRLRAETLLHDDDRRRFAALVSAHATAHRAVEQTDLRAQRRDGSAFWISLLLTPLANDAGEVSALLAVIEDIDARRRAQEEVDAANRRLSDSLVALKRHDRELAELNALHRALQRCTREEEAHLVIGDTMRRLFPHDAGGLAVRLDDTDLFHVVARWGSDEPVGKTFLALDCCAIRDGRALSPGPGRDEAPCRHMAPAGHDDYRCFPLIAEGQTIGLLTLSRIDGRQAQLDMLADATALALANLRLRSLLEHEATHDPLTGLYNRRSLSLELDRELARGRRSGGRLALAMIDADHFKRFNDTHGHEAGDRLLEAFGRIFRTRLRQSDFAARYGGEEFVLVLPDTDSAGAIDLLRAVSAEIAALRESGDAVTVSIGVAVAPEDGDTQNALLRAADAALYRAKANGRARIELATAPATAR